MTLCFIIGIFQFLREWVPAELEHLVEASRGVVYSSKVDVAGGKAEQREPTRDGRDPDPSVAWEKSGDQSVCLIW